MVDTNIRSRSNRRRKKRKNNRNLMIFLALAFLFFTILLSLIVLNKNVDSEVEQDATTDEKEQTENQTNNDTEKEASHSNDDQDTSDSNDEEDKKGENNEEESNESVKEVEQEEIEDSNVKRAFVGEWSPVGTTQEGTHTTNYSNGSQDRKEIKKAVSKVTKVAEDNMVEWRVENGGDQKVIATISDDNETEFYRVYLSWIDNEGWQVNKFEELKKNDKK